MYLIQELLNGNIWSSGLELCKLFECQNMKCERGKTRRITTLKMLLSFLCIPKWGPKMGMDHSLIF